MKGGAETYQNVDKKRGAKEKTHYQLLALSSCHKGINSAKYFADFCVVWISAPLGLKPFRKDNILLLYILFTRKFSTALTRITQCIYLPDFL